MTRRGLLGVLVALPLAPVLADRMAEFAEDASDIRELELCRKRYTDSVSSGDFPGEYVALVV